MKSDAEIKEDAVRELGWDPRVPEPAAATGVASAESRLLVSP
jgi:hypothetical protein